MIAIAHNELLGSNLVDINIHPNCINVITNLLTHRLVDENIKFNISAHFDNYKLHWVLETDEEESKIRSLIDFSILKQVTQQLEIFYNCSDSTIFALVIEDNNLISIQGKGEVVNSVNRSSTVDIITLLIGKLTNEEKTRIILVEHIKY